jgi:hypothetical protein
MHFSRSLNCCLEARAFLGCSPLTVEPCHGFAGDCADLLASFENVVFEGAPGVPKGYVCLQFPNAASTRDSFILGLLSWACSLPVAICVLNCFWCANSHDYEPAWLRWDFTRRLAFGHSDWRYKARWLVLSPSCRIFSADAHAHAGRQATQRVQAPARHTVRAAAGLPAWIALAGTLTRASASADGA